MNEQKEDKISLLIFWSILTVLILSLFIYSLVSNLSESWQHTPSADIRYGFFIGLVFVLIVEYNLIIDTNWRK